MLVDFSGSSPKILFGRRSPHLRFLPGKFVFPGGAVDRGDRSAPALGALSASDERKLLQRASIAPGRARAIAMAAIRELAEETGIFAGRQGAPGRPASAGWNGFRRQGIVPELDRLRLVGRAITPTGMSHRFDTRFFAMDACAAAAILPGCVGPDREFSELCWADVTRAYGLDLHPMTRMIVAEVESRLQDRFEQDMPVPFFHMRRGTFVRELLD